MTELEALAVLLAGTLAGGVNTVVGSGSLITFPTLLAVGYPPVVANVSNTVGSCRAASAACSATGASCAASGAAARRSPSARRSAR